MNNNPEIIILRIAEEEEPEDKKFLINSHAKCSVVREDISLTIGRRRARGWWCHHGDQAYVNFVAFNTQFELLVHFRDLRELDNIDGILSGDFLSRYQVHSVFGTQALIFPVGGNNVLERLELFGRIESDPDSGNETEPRSGSFDEE